MKRTQEILLADPSLLNQPETVLPLQGQHSVTGAVRLPIADILRGLAASWVFLFHASEGRHIDGLVRALPDGLATALFSAGHLGVAVFFVLSGLVIAMSGERCGDGFIPAATFLARRIVRLAPPYYVSLGVVLALMLLKKKFEAEGTIFPEPIAIAAHLLFLQDLLGFHGINSVYWTLCIEVQFYLAFCVLMLAARWMERARLTTHSWIVVMGAACALAALWPYRLVDDSASWHATFLPTWHLFLLGVLLHHAFKNGRSGALPYFVYLAVLTVAAASSGNAFTLAGIVASVFLYGLSRWRGESTWKRLRFLTNLGLISYSFYLLHNPITGAAFNITRRLAGKGIASELAGLVFSFCLCLAAAAISYVAIERPAIRLGRRLRT